MIANKHLKNSTTCFPKLSLTRSKRSDVDVEVKI